MAEVTGLTAARMLEIEAASVVDGTVDLSGHLILTKHDASTIDAGNVVGPAGADGTNGTNGVDATAPTGAIMLFPVAEPPTGWLLCDGSAVDRTTYSALFALIGIIYGSGDGTTTFNLPNTKGRIPVGRDAAQTEFDVIGEVGGAKTHILATTEIPSHQHTMANHTHSGTSSTVSSGHTHNFSTGGRSAAHTHSLTVLIGKLASLANSTGASPGQIIGGVADTRTQQVIPGSSFGTESADHTHSGTTGDINQNHTHTLTTGGPSNNTSDAAGGGGAHNNLQPYIVLNYIIKT